MEDFNEYIFKVRRILIDSGYGRKKLTADEIHNLYLKYGTKVDEKIFITKILLVKLKRYNHIKNHNLKTKILNVKDSIDLEETTKIGLLLLEKGYSMKSIDKKEFYQLYYNYGENLSERSFAVQVLRISYSQYLELINKENSTCIILKNVKDAQEIKQNLIDDGYQGKYVENCNELLEIYNNYGNGLSKYLFFTEVLGISINVFRHLKAGNIKGTYILQTDINEIDVDSLVKKLQSLGYGYLDTDKNKFLEIYEEYGSGLPMKVFATQILFIPEDSYNNLISDKSNVVILKEENIIERKKSDKIVKKLVEDKLVNKPIDSEELVRLYDKYGCDEDYSEKQFALEILNLSIWGYRALKNKAINERRRILKNQINKEIEKIITILINKGYQNKLGNYCELKKLHKEYGYFLTEKQFAIKVLHIPSRNYDDVKRGKKTTFFPLKKLSYNRILEIKQNLIERGYGNASLTKKEIEKLYEEFKLVMSKRVFYENILGIFYTDLTDENRVTTVLKTAENINEEEIEKVKNDLYEKGYYLKRLTIEEIDKLYSSYNNIPFNIFLNRVLGNSSEQYSVAKKRNSCLLVIDENKKIRVNMMLNEDIKEKAQFTKEEIANLCKKYNVLLEDFIYYLMIKKNLKNTRFSISAQIYFLDKTGKLNIYNGSDRSFLNRYVALIKKEIISVLKDKYSSKTIDDAEFSNSYNYLLDFVSEKILFIQNISFIKQINFEKYLFETLKKELNDKINENTKMLLDKYMQENMILVGTLEEAINQMNLFFEWLKNKKIDLDNELDLYLVSHCSAFIENLKIINRNNDKVLSKKIEYFKDLYNETKIEKYNELENFSDLSVADMYLNEVSKYKLLTKEEERELMTKIKNGDEKAKEEFIKRNLRLVIPYAKKYYNKNKHYKFLDIVQEGNLGLIKAINKFDISKDTRFSTYASWWIRQSILSALEDNERTVKLPKDVVILINKIKKFMMCYAQKNEISPSIQEILDEFNLTKDRYDELVPFFEDVSSLNEKLHDDEKTERIDFVKETLYDGSLEENIINENLNNELHNKIYEIFDRLQMTDTKKGIIIMHYGLDGNKPKSFEEIGKILGVSRQRTNAVDKEFLKKIKDNSEILSELAEYLDDTEKIKVLKR